MENTIVSQRIKCASNNLNTILGVTTVASAFTFVSLILVTVLSPLSHVKLNTLQNTLYWVFCTLLGTVSWSLVGSLTFSQMGDYARDHPQLFVSLPLSFKINYIGSLILASISLLSVGSLLVVLPLTFTNLYWEFVFVPIFIGAGAVSVLILGLWN
jgi:hypothetical protein